MMARAASSQGPSLASATQCSSTPSNFVASSGSPMTPVEEMNTSPGLQPAAFAAICAVSFTDSRPFLPVKALALPELTTSARALPPASASRHQTTGAPGHFERVSTPATSVPLSNTAMNTSRRFL